MHENKYLFPFSYFFPFPNLKLKIIHNVFLSLYYSNNSDKTLLLSVYLLNLSIQKLPNCIINNLPKRSNINMSQIAKARDRLLHKQREGLSPFHKHQFSTPVTNLIRDPFNHSPTRSRRSSQIGKADLSPQHSSRLKIKQQENSLEKEKQWGRKFNISSISMKFQKELQPQPISQLKISRRSRSGQRQRSPQFSRTQRINPIRHFEPFKVSALSESNSQSSLRKLQKERRRISMQSHLQVYEVPPQQSQDLSSVPDYRYRHQVTGQQSPIQKMRRTVHTQKLNIVMSRAQTKRAQSPYKPKECLKQMVDDRIRSLNLTVTLYDTEFPPKRTILYPKKIQYTDQGVYFQRLSTLYRYEDADCQLIYHCQPTAIKEGSTFTNPYLLSALRILAEDPSRILEIIQNQKFNERGIYTVRLCKDGVWRYIIVDDFVPVKNSVEGGYRPQFLSIQAVQNFGVCQLWPSLVEKALAKVYGSYYDLALSRRDGICPILRALTGFPVSKYDLIKDVRSYLLLIDSAIQRGHIVVFEQVLPDFEDLAYSKNISLLQSYKILQMSRNHFILRNLNDFQLTTRLSFDQVMMFSSMLIFRKEENYCYISQKLRHKTGYFSQMKMQVPTALNCYLDVWQNNPSYYKHHLDSKIEYEVSPFKIILKPLSIQTESQFDSRPQEIIVVESGKQLSLKKGEYLIQVHLCQKKQLDFTFSYYGEKDIVLERIKNSNRWHQSCCPQTFNSENF